jgi:DNA polymerase alpha subunit A
MKIKYPATMPRLPCEMSGNTFETILGTNKSMLELFILKRKIKGPCWLTISNAKKISADGNRSTWCRQELTVDSPKDVTCKQEYINKQAPPLTSVVLSVKITRSSHNTSEIAMISFLVEKKINQDDVTDDKAYEKFTLIRKLDTLPLPHDFKKRIKQEIHSNISVF